ncbi:MAG: hypothetical protein RMM17_13585 [Acidobacteriota bacterium]|nr:hypothetical protein [Blastocatellia bacterium]MDW8413700.1 hypothetical protein [Acidobacteriota bacterium]
MSAKLTIIFYILICFEVGIILLILPWHTYWEENFFLYYAAAKLHWQWLIDFAHSGYVRGAVSGIGIINLLIGCWEIVDFRKTVTALSPEKVHEEQTSALLDNRPAEDSSAN